MKVALGSQACKQQPQRAHHQRLVNPGTSRVWSQPWAERTHSGPTSTKGVLASKEGDNVPAAQICEGYSNFLLGWGWGVSDAWVRLESWRHQLRRHDLNNIFFVTPNPCSVFFVVNSWFQFCRQNNEKEVECTASAYLSTQPRQMRFKPTSWNPIPGHEICGSHRTEIHNFVPSLDPLSRQGCLLGSLPFSSVSRCWCNPSL